jgi:hypothetical protein
LGVQIWEKLQQILTSLVFRVKESTKNINKKMEETIFPSTAGGMAASLPTPSPPLPPSSNKFVTDAKKRKDGVYS